MRYEFDCAGCGVRVRAYRSPAYKGGPPRFCSQRCNGARRKGTGRGPRPNTRYVCDTCGRTVETYRSPSNVAAVAPRFCSLACLGTSQTGDGNPAWNGGRYFDAAGYALVFAPDHPNCDVRGYVLEHRLVAARMLGRSLLPGEVVHHANGIKDDNRPENLEVLPSQAEHSRRHSRERATA